MSELVLREHGELMHSIYDVLCKIAEKKDPSSSYIVFVGLPTECDEQVRGTGIRYGKLESSLYYAEVPPTHESHTERARRIFGQPDQRDIDVFVNDFFAAVGPGGPYSNGIVFVDLNGFVFDMAMTPERFNVERASLVAKDIDVFYVNGKVMHYKGGKVIPVEDVDLAA